MSKCPLCSSREAIWFSKNNPGNPCLPRSSGRWYWGKSCLIQQRNPRNPCPKIEVTYFSTSVPLFILGYGKGSICCYGYQSFCKSIYSFLWSYFDRVVGWRFFSGLGIFVGWNGGAVMDYLTLGFLAFGLIVLIGFVIVLTDKGLKWKKK